jgi:hypothetical protein
MSWAGRSTFGFGEELTGIKGHCGSCVGSI